MCRTVHALLQTMICAVQLMVRMFMTVILMIENLLRMLLQALYNFASFLVQLLSLIPVCVVFMVTARLKCFLCSGGGNCPINQSGSCDCLISALAVIILFMTFRSTGVLDKIIYKFGYVKARPPSNVTRLPPVDPDPELPPRLLRRIPQNEKRVNKTTVKPKHIIVDAVKETKTAMKNDKTTKEKANKPTEKYKTSNKSDMTTKKNSTTTRENNTTTIENDTTIIENDTTTEENETTTNEALIDNTETELMETEVLTTTKVATETSKYIKRSKLCASGSSKNISKSDDMDSPTTVSWTTILYYLV